MRQARALEQSRAPDTSSLCQEPGASTLSIGHRFDCFHPLGARAGYPLSKQGLALAESEQTWAILVGPLEHTSVGFVNVPGVIVGAICHEDRFRSP